MLLVTGGAGFIGSHTGLALAAAGMSFLIVDNFGNNRLSVLQRIARITGAEPLCMQRDVRDMALLERLFAEL